MTEGYSAITLCIHQARTGMTKILKGKTEMDRAIKKGLNKPLFHIFCSESFLR